MQSCFRKTLDESDGFAKLVGLKKRTTSEDVPFTDGRGKATPRKKCRDENLLQQDKQFPKKEYLIEDTTTDTEQSNHESDPDYEPFIDDIIIDDQQKKFNLRIPNMIVNQTYRQSIPKQTMKHQRISRL